MSAASQRLRPVREMVAEPRPQASPAGGDATGRPSSLGRLELALSVLLDRPKPFLAEHDLPLSPFLATRHPMSSSYRGNLPERVRNGDFVVTRNTIGTNRGSDARFHGTREQARSRPRGGVCRWEED
jgi:hypothetical protein